MLPSCRHTNIGRHEEMAMTAPSALAMLAGPSPLGRDGLLVRLPGGSSEIRESEHP
jgi:hypothetical protein